MLHRLTIATVEERALARDETTRRALVRSVSRVAAGRLLLFSLAADRLDVVVREERPRILGAGLRSSLEARVPGLPLDEPHVRPVGPRTHLLWLVKHFLEPRDDPHGGPAALWTGSCLPDLVGARVLPGFDPQVLRSELPRLRLREVLVHAGLEPTPVEAATDQDLRRVSAARIVDLAAAVHALGPAIVGRGATEVEVRALAVFAARRAKITTALLSSFLGVTARAVCKLGERAVDPRAILALRRRLTLEERAVGRVSLALRPR